MNTQEISPNLHIKTIERIVKICDNLNLWWGNFQQHQNSSERGLPAVKKAISELQEACSHYGHQKNASPFQTASGRWKPHKIYMHLCSSWCTLNVPYIFYLPYNDTETANEAGTSAVSCFLPGLLRHLLYHRVPVKQENRCKSRWNRIKRTNQHYVLVP